MLTACHAPLNRRALSEGLGSVAIALPLLDAMIPGKPDRLGRGAGRRQEGDAVEPPGDPLLSPTASHPAGTSRAGQNSAMVRPHRHLGGAAEASPEGHAFCRRPARVPMALYGAAGDHAKALGCYLTGVLASARTASDDIQCSISMDQVIAIAKIGSPEPASRRWNWAWIMAAWKAAATRAMPASVHQRLLARRQDARDQGSQSARAVRSACSAPLRPPIIPTSRRISRKPIIARSWTTPGESLTKINGRLGAQRTATGWTNITSIREIERRPGCAADLAGRTCPRA